LGRGLGLYSVRLLTEKYLKGTVAFESDPDQGTVFEVFLPKERKK
jgi:signal transduction histidine kinase